MSQKNFKASSLVVSIAVLSVVIVFVAVFRWHLPFQVSGSLLAPRPHLVVLNVIGAAFDQLDFDKTFASSPECRGLTLSRGSEAPDGATYIAGMVLLDGWRWSVDGSTFEASPFDRMSELIQLLAHTPGGGPF